MIVKIPQTYLYTIWVDFQSGQNHIYNIEYLTFDEQQAEQYMADCAKRYSNRNYEKRIFNVNGMEEATISMLKEEIDRREKINLEEKRRIREMEKWVEEHPEKIDNWIDSWGYK